MINILKGLQFGQTFFILICLTKIKMFFIKCFEERMKGALNEL